MLINIATILLGPFLLLQGKQVRKNTPVLPEAAGDREGLSGDGLSLGLLIIGDSAAAGVGAKHQEDALAGKLTSLLQQKYKLQWRLIARTGATSLSTLNMLNKLQPENFDVVVLSLGVNDVTGMVKQEQWLHHQQQLLDKIKSQFTPRLIIVHGIAPMHLFPALPQPLRWYLGKKARLMSAVLKKVVEQEPLAVFMSIDFGGDPQLMASDGFHPGPDAYTIWASNLDDLINSKLAQKSRRSTEDYE